MAFNNLCITPDDVNAQNNLFFFQETPKKNLFENETDLFQIKLSNSIISNQTNKDFPEEIEPAKDIFDINKKTISINEDLLCSLIEKICSGNKLTDMDYQKMNDIERIIVKKFEEGKLLPADEERNPEAFRKYLHGNNFFKTSEEQGKLFFFENQMGQDIFKNIFDKNFLENNNPVIQEENLQKDKKKKKNCEGVEKKINKKKRIEEKNKFFFKKAIKYIEKDYFCSKNKKKKVLKREKDFSSFYQFYFSPVAEKLQISIENFYHPQKKYKNLNPGQKSLNDTYIDLILSSDCFREKVKEYAENYFIDETITSRKKKIQKIIKHFKRIIDDVCKLHSLSLFEKEGILFK